MYISFVVLKIGTLQFETGLTVKLVKETRSNIHLSGNPEIHPLIYVHLRIERHARSRNGLTVINGHTCAI
jgi:hypothetical protein